MAHTDSFDCKMRLVKEFTGKKIVDVDHHLCHAAASFFSSPFESAAIISLDGFGDGASGLLARGSGSQIEVMERISEENSIGLEYLRATVHLGLGGYGSEGKTQGLAAYGEPIVFEQYMNEIEVTPGGNLRLGQKLQTESSRNLAEEGGYLNAQILNNSFLNDYCLKRIDPEPLTSVHMNLAASIQKVLEQVAEKLCLIIKQRTGLSDLVLGGGVSMNSSMNGYLLSGNLFNHIYALPMASDRGTGLGAALYYAHQILRVARFFVLEQVYYGGHYNDKAAKKAMKKAGLKVRESDDPAGEAAQALSQSRIVGWMQGRAELGARALGNRSILADPRRKDMKDIVNLRVKHREWFRPFAPAIPNERAKEFFLFPENAANLSFMTFTVPANKSTAGLIPSVVHVDGSARVQTVFRQYNPLYVRIMEKFGELTGVPAILNTSFNDQGDPIVETPEDAVKTFLKADMDMLIIGNIIGIRN